MINNNCQIPTGQVKKLSQSCKFNLVASSLVINKFFYTRIEKRLLTEILEQSPTIF